MSIHTLYTDVGGVLLNNGWDTQLRNAAADHFGIDHQEMQQRHEMVFEDYERGRLLLDEYLHHVVFFKERSFSMDDFKQFIFDGSTSYLEMIGLMKELKQRFKLRIAVLSNEGQEIAVSRFKKFDFDSFVDFYVVSGFIGVRKPDLRIFKMAWGLCQKPPENIIYIDDRLPSVEIAQRMGICAFHHTDYEKTKQVLLKKLESK